MESFSKLDGQPWLTHVWYAVDDNLDIYFVSNAAQRHSSEIRSNSRVAAGVIAIELEGPGQKVRGISLEGDAEEIGARSLPHAFRVYSRRWPQVSKIATQAEFVKHATKMRFYRIRPKRIILFDQVNFPDSPQRELTL
jgi:uncharacterized protein YhbP (UPF0306 family)